MDPNDSRNQNTDMAAGDDLQDIHSESLGMAGGLGMVIDDTPRPVPTPAATPEPTAPQTNTAPATPVATPDQNTLPEQTFGDTFSEGIEPQPIAPAPAITPPTAPISEVAPAPQPVAQPTPDVAALQAQAEALQAQLAQLNSTLTGLQETPAPVAPPEPPVVPQPTPTEPVIQQNQEPVSAAEQLQKSATVPEPDRQLTPFEELKQLQASREDVAEPIVTSAPEATDTPAMEEELLEAVSDPGVPTGPEPEPTTTPGSPIAPAAAPIADVLPTIEPTEVAPATLPTTQPNTPTPTEPAPVAPEPLESSILQPVRTFHADVATAQGLPQPEPAITPAPAPVNPKPANPLDRGTSRTPAELQMNETLTELQNTESVQPDLPTTMPKGPSKGLENLNALKARMDYESTHKGTSSEPEGVRDMLDISQPAPAPSPTPQQPLAPVAQPATPPEAAPVTPIQPQPVTSIEPTPQPVTSTPVAATPEATIVEQHAVPTQTPPQATPAPEATGQGRSFFDKLNTIRNDTPGSVQPDQPAAFQGVSAPASAQPASNVPVGFEQIPQRPVGTPGAQPQSMDDILNQATRAQNPVASPQPPVQPQAPTAPNAAPTQPGGAPFPPNNPKGPGTAKLRPVRTFKDDLEQTVQRKNTSFVNIVSAEQDRKAQTAHQQEKPKPIQKTSNSLLMVAGSGLLVGVGIAALVFAFYLYTKAPETVPVVSVPEYIFTNDQRPVDLTNADKTNLLRLLETAKDTSSLELGEISHLYLVKQNLIEGTQITENITPEEFFVTLDSNAPPGMIRSLDSFMMYGAHFFAGGNQPFFIFKTDSYDFAFGGMLEWEPNLNEDLSPLFGPVVQTIITQPIVVSTSTATSTDTTASTTNTTIVQEQPVTETEQTFEDDIIRNQDVRVLRNQESEIVLLYGFPDASTLVITTNEHTYAEIATRLSSRRF